MPVLGDTMEHGARGRGARYHDPDEFWRDAVEDARDEMAPDRRVVVERLASRAGVEVSFRTDLGRSITGFLDTMFIDIAIARERIIRNLLGRWVSELEPCLIIDEVSGRILGLGLLGDQSERPTVVIRA